MYVEGGRALAQASQEVCGVSLSGEIKNPPGTVSI